MWPFKNGFGILSVILSKTKYQQKPISKQNDMELSILLELVW